MTYKVIFERSVTKFLKNCDKNVKQSFVEKLEILLQDPFSAYRKLDVKSLVDEENMYRMRIWKYRFLYVIQEEKLVVVFVDADSRWWIYK